MAKQEKVNYVKNIVNIWFPNQKEPEFNSDEFIPFWKREKDRCINGFKIANNQVYIPGWLYFHTVYWTIELDKEFINPVTGKKSSGKTKGTPTFRDNEWMIGEDLERVQIEKKIYDLVSCRGVGKSMWAGSFIGQSYLFFNDSENLLSGGNNPDIHKLAEKVALGIDNIHPVFSKQRIKNNWKQEVRAGWEDKSTGTVKGSNSRILTRNYDNGNNSMATNGTRPLRQIIDEQGKIEQLIKCLLDSMPSWMNDYGFFSIVFLTGTGGQFEVGEDAGKVFSNPALYNVLEFDDIWEGKGKIGRFIPVTQGRNEFKEPWSLYKYLKEKVPQYKNLEYHPDLDIIIQVSNEERCMEEFVIPRRERAMKSTSSNEIISEKAYYPIVPSECFLTLDSNDFPVESVKQQIEFIKRVEFKPQRIKLFVDITGRIDFSYTDEMPVTDFPITAKTNKKGVIEIIEHPVQNAPHGLYVIGIDPYKLSESDYSDSLGSVTVYKRSTTNMYEPFQNMPVCWYHGRPAQIKDWYENARLIAEYFNASIMCENIDGGFIDYMIGLNKQHYLAKGQSYLKEIAPTSKHKGEYGLPPTPKTITHWLNAGVKYTKELFDKISIDNKEKKEQLGVTRVLDINLLNEMSKFNKNSGNFDKIRSFCIAVAYANQLDGQIGKVAIEEEERKKIKYIRGPFSSMNNISSRENSRYNRKINSPFLINKTR